MCQRHMTLGTASFKFYKSGPHSKKVQGPDSNFLKKKKQREYQIDVKKNDHLH